MHLDLVATVIQSLWSSLTPPVEGPELHDLVEELASANDTTAEGIGWWVTALAGANGNLFDVQRLAREARIIPSRVGGARVSEAECVVLARILTEERDRRIGGKLRAIRDAAQARADELRMTAHFLEDTTEESAEVSEEIVSMRTAAREALEWLALVEAALRPITLKAVEREVARLSPQSLDDVQMARLRAPREYDRRRATLLECPRCHSIWAPRIASPKRCPICQARLAWDDGAQDTQDG